MKTPIKTRIVLGAVALVMLAGMPSASGLPPGDPGESDPIISLPIITFNGAALAEHYPGLVDAGSLEGTKDLSTGEVSLLFTGAVGKVSCGGGSGIVVIVGSAPESGSCSASITANDLDCRASFRYSGDAVEYSWGDGFGVCTIEEI